MALRSWMIYGASGYTGSLIVEEAVRRGHRPLLAGRSAERLIPLAKRWGLDYRVANLQDERTLSRIVAEVNLVLHAAGPFIHTSDPMVRVCLKNRVHYVDIAGEVPALENVFSYQQEAKERGIVLLPGAGFDVIATDCMGKYVADRISDPISLDLAVAFTSRHSPSPGTLHSILEQIPGGPLALRNWKIVSCPMERALRRVRFLDRERAVFPVTWGDLATASRTNGIPNVTTYMAFGNLTTRMLRWGEPVIRRLLSRDMIRRWAQNWIRNHLSGPDEETRKSEHTYVWARARNEKGETAEGWLETIEGYWFTAISGVRSVEMIFKKNLSGALTPASTFGADFVAEIGESRRYDRLDAITSE